MRSNPWVGHTFYHCLASSLTDAACSCSRKIVRGALIMTDGRKWIFLLLKVDEERGGTYYQSREIAIVVADERVLDERVLDERVLDERVLDERVSKQRCDVVAGILAHWVSPPLFHLWSVADTLRLSTATRILEQMTGSRLPESSRDAHTHFLLA